MKNTIALALVACTLLFTADAWGQRRMMTFDDGTELEVDFLSDDPDDFRPLWLNWGAFAEGSLNGLGIDYWLPGKGRVQLTTSLVGTDLLREQEDSLYAGGSKPAHRPWRIKGHYFLKTWDKTKPTKITLSSKSTGYNEITAYVTEEELPRRHYLSLHGGVGYQNLEASYGPYRYYEVAVGLSLMRLRHMDLMVVGEGKSGFRQSRGGAWMELYADALFFAGAETFRVDSEPEEMSAIGVEAAWMGGVTLGKAGKSALIAKAGLMVGPFYTTAVYGFGFSFALMDDARSRE